MKIGLLVNNIDQLSNWQIRIIEGIYKDQDLETVLLVTDTFNENWRLGFAGSVCPKGTKLTGVSGFLLHAQQFIESRFLFKAPSALPNAFLNEVAKLKLTKTTLKEISVDLLINLGTNTLSADVLKISKHGVWELLFKDSSLENDGPIGFWEVLQKKPVIATALIKFDTSLQMYSIVDKAYFNRHWSMTETATIASEGSVSLLFKHLQKLKRNKLVNTVSALPVVSNINQPNFLSILKYTALFYGEFFNKIYEKLITKVVDRRYECWTIFTGSKGFYQDITTAAVALKMPKDEFWADPFLFHHKGKDYLFFENYSYTTKRGKISCGILKNNELTNVIDVLDLDFHLSFPFIYEENGDIFLMPESSENKNLEIYKAVDFPITWESYTTAFEGQAVGDAFFHTDSEQQQWLFLNKQAAATSPMNSELFIYKVDSNKLHTLIPHKQNPVIIDASVARNGGAIFEHDNEFYRPSQRNIDGVYGRSLNINKIEKLTIEEYKETTVQIIEPDFDTKLMGLHHLHKCNGTFVFDAVYRYK